MSVIHSGERERKWGEHGAVLDKNWKKLVKLLSIEPTWWCFVSGGVAPRLADLVESVSFFKYLLLLFVLWGVA
jgi:hypothetical protein